MTICIDTQIVIWGVQRKAEPPCDSMVLKAETFLRQLDASGERIIIPTPVIWEYLIGVPEPHHEATLAVFSKRFRVCPFDAKAARTAAELWRTVEGDLTPEEVKRLGGRNRLKVDCQIVAVALDHDAEAIYSYDHGMPKFADGRIAVRPLPDVVEQGNLFAGEAQVAAAEDE